MLWSSHFLFCVVEVVCSMSSQNSVCCFSIVSNALGDISNIFATSFLLLSFYCISLCINPLFIYHFVHFIYLDSICMYRYTIDCSTGHDIPCQYSFTSSSKIGLVSVEWFRYKPFIPYNLFVISSGIIIDSIEPFSVNIVFYSSRLFSLWKHFTVPIKSCKNVSIEFCLIFKWNSTFPHHLKKLESVATSNWIFFFWFYLYLHL